jgi:hypothetical protein
VRLCRCVSRSGSKFRMHNSGFQKKQLACSRASGPCFTRFVVLDSVHSTKKELHYIEAHILYLESNSNPDAARRLALSRFAGCFLIVTPSSWSRQSVAGVTGRKHQA